MMESIFSNVSPESIVKVFNCVCSNIRISKKDIASITGLSVMTVGKITDGLRKSRALRTLKQSNTTPGRRAAELYPDNTKSIIIIDATPTVLSIDVFDMSLQSKMHYEKRHEFCALIDNETNDFIKNVIEKILKSFRPDRCIGIGMIFQGKYIPEAARILSHNNSQLSSLYIPAHFIDCFPESPLIHISSQFAAASEISETEKDGFLYVRIGERDITAVPVLSGIPFCDRFGDIVSAGDMNIGSVTASSRFSMSKTIDDGAETVSRLIAQCRTMIPFSKVYIDVTEYMFCDFYEQIRDHMRHQPHYARDIQIFKCKDRVSRIYAAKEVRNYYIGNIIKNHCNI